MLIAEYILRERTKNGTMPENPALVETIVTEFRIWQKQSQKLSNVALIEVLTDSNTSASRSNFLSRAVHTIMYLVWKRAMAAWPEHMQEIKMPAWQL